MLKVFQKTFNSEPRQNLGFGFFICYTNNMRKKIIFSLVFLNILAWIAVFSLNNSFLEVTFFDIGQGDSSFIEIPNGYQILVDGGPNSKVLEKLSKQMPFWDRTIDLIILTHPEHDHLSGLLGVLERYKVENILWTGVINNTSEFQEWSELIKKEGAKIYIAQKGQIIKAGNAYAKILYPFENLEGTEPKNINDTSIVFSLFYDDNSFLFTGDVSKSVELKLGKVDSDVLKVGHHGSKTSTSRSFVEMVSPEIAVISLGKENSYGHPHLNTLQSLEGVKVLRTDLEGDIKIASDGSHLLFFK